SSTGSWNEVDLAASGAHDSGMGELSLDPDNRVQHATATSTSSIDTVSEEPQERAEDGAESESESETESDSEGNGRRERATDTETVDASASNADENHATQKQDVARVTASQYDVEQLRGEEVASSAHPDASTISDIVQHFTSPPRTTFPGAQRSIDTLDSASTQLQVEKPHPSSPTLSKASSPPTSPRLSHTGLFSLTGRYLVPTPSPVADAAITQNHSLSLIHQASAHSTDEAGEMGPYRRRTNVEAVAGSEVVAVAYGRSVGSVASSVQAHAHGRFDQHEISTTAPISSTDLTPQSPTSVTPLAQRSSRATRPSKSVSFHRDELSVVVDFDANSPPKILLQTDLSTVSTTRTAQGHPMISDHTTSGLSSSSPSPVVLAYPDPGDGYFADLRAARLARESDAKKYVHGVVVHGWSPSMSGVPGFPRAGGSGGTGGRMHPFPLPYGSNGFGFEEVVRVEDIRLKARTTVGVSVVVRNVAFDKRVVVRYSFDGWRTWTEGEARFLGK
ncbi:hypothetical protein HDU93_002457, partial [Gonapodya sp. JEL0774]